MSTKLSLDWTNIWVLLNESLKRPFEQSSAVVSFDERVARPTCRPIANALADDTSYDERDLGSFGSNRPFATAMGGRFAKMRILCGAAQPSATYSSGVHAATCTGRLTLEASSLRE